MVRLYCSPLQVKKATHETMISVFSSEHSTSFMINIKGLELNPEDIDDAGLQLLAAAVAKTLQRVHAKNDQGNSRPHLKAV